MHFNDIETLLVASLALAFGHLVHRFVPCTARYNLPGSVLGGFTFAVLFLVLRLNGLEFEFSMNTQSPLMILFFASLGFSASFSRLLAGGKPLIVFFLLTCGVLFIQNMVGLLIAMGLGQHPLFGIMTGSVSLVGGPGTALAFAPLFEEAGLKDSAAIGLASAVCGIILAGLFGGPLSTYLVDKFRLSAHAHKDTHPTEKPHVEHFAEHKLTDWIILHLAVLVITMALGAYVSQWINHLGITLPPYIGAMIIAAVIRNLDDKTHFLDLRDSWLDSLGSAALAYFIAMTMMNLDFLALKDIGFSLLIVMIVQVAIMLLAARFIIFPYMGRNYESAVLSGGFFGFMMGTVANAMANIETIQRKKGPAPSAGLFISLVGACFIDVVNAAVITVFINIF